MTITQRSPAEWPERAVGALATPACPALARLVQTVPTVLAVDRDHIVRFVDIHPDYTGRTEVDEILAALHVLPSS